ncbi:MAG: peptidylprolyl isomerase [Rhodobacteraceae bacterium]|nr:peptidylprolyl isomerase [Paracoccaceae bacterium]
MRNLLAASAVSALLVLQTNIVLAQDAEEAVMNMTADSVIATVNDTEITLGHVIQLRQQLPGEYQNLPDEVLFEGIITQLIEQTLLANEVDADNLPYEVVIALENEARAQMAAVQIEKIVSHDVTDEELQAFYAEAIADFDSVPEFNASHILVETEEEAEELLVALEEGAVFADLAIEKSTGPSGPNGGDLGWFGLGEMVTEFEEAVLLLEVGEVSPVVQTQFGWHVLILDDRRETVPPTLDEIRPQMMDGMRQQSVTDAIEALKEASEITQVEGLDPALMRDLSLLED